MKEKTRIRRSLLDSLLNLLDYDIVRDDEFNLKKDLIFKKYPLDE